MPTFNHGKNAVVLLDNTNLSTTLTDASVSLTADVAETSTFSGGASSGKTFVAGLKDGTATAGEAYTLGASDLEQLALDGLPTTQLDLGTMPPTLTQMLSEVGMVSSGKQVKDALGNGAVFVNGVPVTGAPPIDPADCFRFDNALHERYWIVRLGKKKYHRFTRG